MANQCTYNFRKTQNEQHYMRKVTERYTKIDHWTLYRSFKLIWLKQYYWSDLILFCLWIFHFFRVVDQWVCPSNFRQRSSYFQSLWKFKGAKYGKVYACLLCLNSELKWFFGWLKMYYSIRLNCILWQRSSIWVKKKTIVRKFITA